MLSEEAFETIVYGELNSILSNLSNMIISKTDAQQWLGA